MYIKPSEFTEETREVLDLFDDEVQFFDIVLDETGKGHIDKIPEEEKEDFVDRTNEILNQLDVMKKGEFTDEDFTSSITALSDAFKGVEDSPVAVCTFYSSQAFDDVIVTGQEYAEKIASVTREQIVECAKRVRVDSVYLLAGESGNNE